MQLSEELFVIILILASSAGRASLPSSSSLCRTKVNPFCVFMCERNSRTTKVFFTALPLHGSRELGYVRCGGDEVEM